MTLLGLKTGDSLYDPLFFNLKKETYDSEFLEILWAEGVYQGQLCWQNISPEKAILTPPRKISSSLS